MPIPFPNQCVSLAAPGLPILERGKSGRPARLRAKQDIVERAVKGDEKELDQ